MNPLRAPSELFLAAIRQPETLVSYSAELRCVYAPLLLRTHRPITSPIRLSSIQRRGSSLFYNCTVRIATTVIDSVLGWEGSTLVGQTPNTFLKL